MLVKNQMVEVHWCPANKKHYESKGYHFTKYREALLVRAEDLMDTSTIQVKVICDYCHKEYITSYKLYKKGLSTNNKNACKDCSLEKAKETNTQKYGYENPFESKEVQEKIKTTNLQKYGCENVGQNEEVKEKIKFSNLKKYGDVSPLKNASIQEKIKKTNLKKYGAENVFQSESVKRQIAETIFKKYGCYNISQAPSTIEKVKKTNLQKRGVTCSLQDPKVIAKCRKTLSENGSVPVSKAEIQMCEYLADIFGKENCFPSYPYDRITFDCLVVLNDVKIDVEYDGWYWHKNNLEKDKKRNYFVTKNGIKVLRFRAKNAIPSKDLIEKAIKELVKSSEMLKIIDLDI